MATQTQIDADEADGERMEQRMLFWRAELENAMVRERTYRKNAERVVKIYEADTRTENSFNILFANTETLLPACYNQMPRPFVDRRFKDADQQGKYAAQALERTLSALQDSGDGKYEQFTKLMEYAVLGALIPGRGCTWFKYDADLEREEEEVALPENADATQQDARSDVSGEEALEVPGEERVKYETVCGEDVDYDELLFGPGRTWAAVPWVARAHFMTAADATMNFGAKLAGDLAYSKAMADGTEWKKRQPEEAYPMGSQNTTLVWEIWNKERREVLFYAPSCPERMLKEVDDPYGLSGFFPCPEPLRFMLKSSKLTPTPLYVLYEEQAKELNKITTRINKVLSALKVRGFYDGTLGGLKMLLESEDNTLLPAENTAAMQAGQNIQNSVWFMPLEVLVTTLQSLWQGREELKDTIYEITGMADIMRGEGAASAPAATQNIKNQWGTLRLKRWQRYVQEYVRGCLRIMGELAGKHFSVETFAQMTDLDFALPADIKRAQETLAAIQQQIMQMQQMQAQQAMQAQMQQGPPPGAGGPPNMAPPPGSGGAAGGDSSSPLGPPGGPPPAPLGAPGYPQSPSLGPAVSSGPPEMQQAMDAAQAVLAKPAWEEVVAFLREDLTRNFRIDIETNSTIAVDTQEDKDNIADAMGALSTMFQGFLPLVSQGILPLPVMKSILLTVARRFSFGREVEDAINAMADQLPPPAPDPKAPSPAEQQATQVEAQADLQAAQIKMQAAQREEEAAQMRHGFDMQKAQRDDQLAQQRHQFDMQKLSAQMQEIMMKGQAAQATAQSDMMTAGLKVQREDVALKAATARAKQQAQKPTSPANPPVGRA